MTAPRSAAQIRKEWGGASFHWGFLFVEALDALEAREQEVDKLWREKEAALQCEHIAKQELARLREKARAVVRSTQVPRSKITDDAIDALAAELPPEEAPRA